jgi:hypothetical protein
MKVLEYVNKTDLGSSGLPQGDTFIDLATSDIVEGKNDEGKTTFNVTLPDGKSHFLPKTVMREIQEIAKSGKTKVRITRTGKTQTDTRYTVIAQL